MQITSPIFDAFLKCPTKCYLRSLGETGSGNEYAEWVRGQDESYQREAARRLQEAVPETERAVVPPVPENIKVAKWRLGLDLVAQTANSADSQTRDLRLSEETQGLGSPGTEQLLESRLHAVEHVPSEGRGKPAQYIPIRFVFRNKLTRDDRLLLAFDALALSQVLGRDARLGKIIHGDDHVTLRVKTSPLAGEVRKRLETIAALLSSPAPPDLVLNPHCAQCEFQTRCRQKALEKDDLSLLAAMSAKERQKLRSKGIFTVTQLSYTFRPRRRPKQLRDKRERYHHSLKALAIREKKVHIVGSPELKVEGTPVYLDVEGVPDRDFYYLIGLRIGRSESAAQHSFWAATVEEEGKIWREFLGILERVDNPVLVHYGSYETTFMKRMYDRYGDISADFPITAKAIRASLNALSFVFSRVYFPTFSNGLKDVARFVGFDWSDPHASGTKTICLRNEWTESGRACAKDALLTYNAEDCIALQKVVEFITRLCSAGGPKSDGDGQSVVNTDSLPCEGFGYFGSNQFQLPGLDEINRAAYWDYQREKVLVKTSKQLVNARRREIWRYPEPKANKVIEWFAPPGCPKCGHQKLYKHTATSKTVLDVRLAGSGLKRWVTRYDFYRYRCTRCNAIVHNPDRAWSGGKYGETLRAFVVYQMIELLLPQETVARFLHKFLCLNVCRGTTNKLKVAAAQFYRQTYDDLLTRIVAGRLVHADETKVSFKSRIGYVWVFTNLSEVAFVFAESREGDWVRSLLKDFKGVLVSDFYAAYDGIECPQQKCLIHLIRDLNDDLMGEPFNQELKALVGEFTRLLRPIIATVDRYGLKKRFLRKHKVEVERFYRALAALDVQSDVTRKCKARLQKNQDTLFTFIDHDGVPWNNNNAEHAIKSFVFLRHIISGITTEKGIREYLILLSICQTCKYMGVDFLDFLRSGEKDIRAFAESRRGRRTQTNQRDNLPGNAVPNQGGQPLPLRHRTPL